MHKCLAVVAFVLLVLSGAMGLRNIAATYSGHAGSVLTAQGGPHPPMPRGGN
jgi:hypothetical protein